MRSGFFNSEITGYDEEGMPIFDCAEEADFFAKYFSMFVGNGVYPNPSAGLQILEDVGMYIKVGEGCCFINGRLGWEDETEQLTIDASEQLDRIDRVVARLDMTDKKIKPFVKKGVASLNPVAPTIERSSDVYELALADVRVKSNVSKITQADITDLRLNKELCGIVSTVVEQVDTTTIFNQYQSWYTNFTQTSKEMIDAWFEKIKGQLSGDVATNLALLIDELEKNKADRTELEVVKQNNTQQDKRIEKLENYKQRLEQNILGKNMFDYDRVGAHAQSVKEIGARKAYKRVWKDQTYWAIFYTNQINMIEGHTYTLSFEVRCTANEVEWENKNVFINDSIKKQHNLDKITTAWQKIVVTFVYKESTTPILHIYPKKSTNTDIYVSNVLIKER